MKPGHDAKHLDAGDLRVRAGLLRFQCRQDVAVVLADVLADVLEPLLLGRRTRLVVLGVPVAQGLRQGAHTAFVDREGLLFFGHVSALARKYCATVH